MNMYGVECVLENGATRLAGPFYSLTEADRYLMEEWFDHPEQRFRIIRLEGPEEAGWAWYGPGSCEPEPFEWFPDDPTIRAMLDSVSLGR